MAGERLPARFSLRSQLWFRWTRKCFETATSHMQTVRQHFEMKLYTNCKKCKKEIRFSTWEPDRTRLAMTQGKKLELKCKKCGQTQKYHVNELIAEESKIALIIGLLIFLVGTPLTVYWLWGYLFKVALIYSTITIAALIGVPLTIFTLIERGQREKVSRFNSFKLNE